MSHTTAHAARSNLAGFRSFVLRAKFLTIFDFKTMPFDDQFIKVPMQMDATLTSDLACFAVVGERDMTFVNIPSEYEHPLWKVSSFTSELTMKAANPIVFLQPTAGAAAVVPHFSWMERMKVNHTAEWDTMFLVTDPTSTSTATCSVEYTIHVHRQNVYHVINYLAVECLLVLLGWTTFFIDPISIDSRISISLTLLLAINVFQVVLVENMPEVGYITNLQLFTCLNTLLLALITLESLLISFARKVVHEQRELDRYLRAYVNKPTARMAARKLQRAWRKKKLDPPVVAYCETAATPAHAVAEPPPPAKQGWFLTNMSVHNVFAAERNVDAASAKTKSLGHEEDNKAHVSFNVMEDRATRTQRMSHAIFSFNRQTKLSCAHWISQHLDWLSASVFFPLLLILNVVMVVFMRL